MPAILSQGLLWPVVSDILLELIAAFAVGMGIAWMVQEYASRRRLGRDDFAVIPPGKRAKKLANRGGGTPKPGERPS